MLQALEIAKIRAREQATGCCGELVEYTQCKLVKPGPVISQEMIVWIPAEFSVVDKVLRFWQADGSWDGGWRVAKTWGTRIDIDKSDSILCECGA